MIDIDGDGDVNGHTLIHTHGSIVDVDITQSGVNDNYISLTASADNGDIDISHKLIKLILGIFLFSVRHSMQVP